MFFSILIPAYKTRFLNKAIESVLAQTYSNFELIIVDDCSPENIPGVIANYHDSRIRFHRNIKNCGAINVVDNWNICLDYATGDYVICMGDDDMLLPNCLLNYCSLIGKYPNLSIYHAWTQIIDEEDNIVTFQEQRPEIESAISFLWHRWNRRNEQYIGDFLFRRADLIVSGGFYKLPMAWASDDISAFRAALTGGYVANTQDISFSYRVNSQTISSSGSQKVKVEATLLEKEWYSQVLSMIKPASYSDTVMFNDLTERMNVHFKERIYHLLQRDISASITNYFYWVSNRNRLGLSLLQITKQVVLNFVGKIQ